MPLSEHEQRLLDQIERALYAEDPKFASTVRGGRLRKPTRRRRLQGVALFVVGLVMLVLGIAVLYAFRPPPPLGAAPSYTRARPACGLRLAPSAVLPSECVLPVPHGLPLLLGQLWLQPLWPWPRLA